LVARSGRYVQMEGKDRAWSTVTVIQDFDAVVTCGNSPGYPAALKIFKCSSKRELVILEGA